MHNEEIQSKGIQEKETQEKSLTFKHWLIRTILIAVASVLLVMGVQYFFHIEILTQSLIALLSAVMIGLAHEALHYVRTRLLGYSVTWYRIGFTVGFEIEHSSIRGIDTPEKLKIKRDIKKIAHFPYIFIVPLSIGIIIIGWYYWWWGLIIAGCVMLMYHGIRFRKEGVSE